MALDLSYWGEYIHLWHLSRSHLSFCICPIQLSNGKFKYSVFCPAGESGSYPSEEFDTVELAVAAGLQEVALHSAAILQIDRGTELLTAGKIGAIEFNRIETAAWSWLKER